MTQTVSRDRIFFCTSWTWKMKWSFELRISPESPLFLKGVLESFLFQVTVLGKMLPSEIRFVSSFVSNPVREEWKKPKLFVLILKEQTFLMLVFIYPSKSFTRKLRFLFAFEITLYQWGNSEEINPFYRALSFGFYDLPWSHSYWPMEPWETGLEIR